MDGPLPSFLFQNRLIEDANLNFVAMIESIALYMVNTFAFVPFLYRFETVFWSIKQLFRYINVVWNYHPSNLKFFLFCSVIFLIDFLQAFLHAIASSWYHDYNIQIIYPMSNKCTPNLPYFDGKFNFNSVCHKLIKFM